jgi:hypothetical protein
MSPFGRIFIVVTRSYFFPFFGLPLSGSSSRRSS